MIVVVESNFVIEFAFRQAEFAAAHQLMILAERGVIELVVPACALFEPYETLVRAENNGPKRSGSFGKKSHNSEGLSISRSYPRPLRRSHRPCLAQETSTGP